MPADDYRISRRHLQTHAYASDGPLNTRIRTHQLYTQPPLDLPEWALDRIAWRGDETVLDVGCGSGIYAEKVIARLGDGGRLINADLSFGMLHDLAQNEAARDVPRLNADVTHLPLPDRSMDVVLANHMLFVVPDIPAAAAEIRRVLRPGGHLVAATNGQASMSRFDQELEAACRALGYAPGDYAALLTAPVFTRFCDQNGGALLRTAFPDVRLHAADNALVFPEAGPMIAYQDSRRSNMEDHLPPGLTWEALLGQIHRQVSAVIEAEGEYRVAKREVVFVAGG